jgi:hypothetical protein
MTPRFDVRKGRRVPGPSEFLSRVVRRRDQITPQWLNNFLQFSPELTHRANSTMKFTTSLLRVSISSLQKAKLSPRSLRSLSVGPFIQQVSHMSPPPNEQARPFRIDLACAAVRWVIPRKNPHEGHSILEKRDPTQRGQTEGSLESKNAYSSQLRIYNYNEVHALVEIRRLT